MPQVKEILDRLTKARTFSRLDAFSGYHQIGVKNEDIEKLHLIASRGLLKFLDAV